MDRGVSVTKTRTGLIVGCIASFILSGCDGAKDAVSPLLADSIPQDPALEVSELIKKDDPSACAHEMAIDVTLGAANRDYRPFLEAGGPRILVDMISTRKIDSNIHEITCSAVLHYQVGELDRTAPMEYTLRPALDNGGGFVTEMKDVPGVRLGIVLHINAWNEAQQAMNEPAVEESFAEGQSDQTSPSFPSEEAPIPATQTADGSDLTAKDENKTEEPASDEAVPAQDQ